MRRLLRVTYLLLLLSFFIHCSSVRQATSTADQTGQPAASEALPADTALMDRDTLTTILPDSIAGNKSLVTDTTRLTQTADSLTALTDTLLTATRDSLTLTAQDSLTIATQDSLSIEAQDSISVTEKQTLEAAVFYTAKDSMIFTSDNMGYLYGEADIKYGEMGIKGEYITMDMDSSLISSTYGVDS